MGAVWMVRSRQLFTSFRFWLALFGYNPRDHSFSQKLYLVYAAIFYLLWTFAVLSLFAGGAAQVLASLQNLLGPASTGISSVANIAPAASLVGWLGLVIWWLIAAYTAARRSPLNFSEEDARRPAGGRPGLAGGPMAGQLTADRHAGDRPWFFIGGRGKKGLSDHRRHPILPALRPAQRFDHRPATTWPAVPGLDSRGHTPAAGA